jgi:DNA-binding transcriptional regulator YhcF (GntR family)
VAANLIVMVRAPEEIGLEGFDVTIDRDAEVPIGVQLAWALRARIRDGRFEPNQRLPGLREMAEAVGVNVNTVRAVYQNLEHEGLIDSQQGSGTFVASTRHKPSAVGTIAADAAREAHATGVDPREVAAALYVASEPPARPADEAAERRRQLRTQIAGLERTLGELEAKHPGLAPAPTQTHAGIGPALLGSEQLEQVLSMLVHRLAATQTAIDALGRKEDPGEAVGERKRKAATAGKRAGRSPIARPPAKTRPATAGA